MDELVIATPLFRRTLHISDKPYYMHRTRNDGEQDLYKLVDKTSREADWWYYPERNIWLYLASEHAEKQGGLEMGLTAGVPVEAPFGNQKMHYHLHPKQKEIAMLDNYRKEFGHMKAYELLIAVLNAVPSLPDYNAATEIIGSAFNVISPRGRVIMNQGASIKRMNDAEYNNLWVNGFNKETFISKGFAQGMDELLGCANAFLQGYVAFEFRPRTT